MNKKLYRDEYHKVLGGVCSGLADYFEMDVTIVRLLFAFTFFVMGVGLGTYIILWIVLPKRGFPYNPYNNMNVDYTVPPQQPNDDAAGQNNPWGNNPYENKAWKNNPYKNNPWKNSPWSNNPSGSNPVDYTPNKQKSHAGIIVGTILIIIGGAILIDNFDLIPDFDFERLWPAVLVFVGAALIISGQVAKPWEHKNWQADAETKQEPLTDTPPAADETAHVE